MNGPVHLFVTLFSQCLYHCIIVKFSGVFIIDKSDVLAKVQSQRSRSQVKTNFVPIWALEYHNSSSLNAQMAIIRK